MIPDRNSIFSIKFKLYRFDALCAEAGMRIKVTNWRSREKYGIRLGEISLRQVEEFMYLGVCGSPISLAGTGL